VTRDAIAEDKLLITKLVFLSIFHKSYGNKQTNFEVTVDSCFESSVFYFSSLRHPNIVQLMEIYDNPSHLYLVMQL